MVDKDSGAPASAPKAASVWKKRLLMALACVAAYALLGFLAAPALLRWQGEIQLAELLKREVKIERVAINPFTLTLDIGGFHVRPTGSDRDDAGFEQFHANLELESLIRGGPVLKEIRLVAPQFRLVLLDSERNNWTDVIERLASGPDEEAGGTHFAINNIQLVDGRVELDDQVRGVLHKVENLSIGLPFVSNLPSKVSIFVEPLLSAVIDGARFEVTGRSIPFSETKETVLDFQFRDLELARYLSYLPFEPRFKVNAGKLGSTLEVRFSQPDSGSAKLSVSGGLEIAGLDLRNSAGQGLLAIGALELDIEELAPLERRFALRSLRLDEPVIEVRRDTSGRIGLLDLAPEPAVKGAEPPAETEPGPVIDFRLAELRVARGRIGFSDRVPARPFDIRLDGLNIEASALSLEKGAAAPFKLALAAEGGLELNVDGSVVPADGSLDLQVGLKGAELQRFAPYYGDAIHGGQVDKGLLDAALRLRLPEADLDRMTVTEGVLGIRDFALGVEGAKSAPIDIASLEASALTVDMAARKVIVGRLVSRKARIEAVRLRDGSIDLAALFDGADKDAAPAASDAQAPWLVENGRLELADWTIRMEDRTSAPHSQMLASKVALSVDGLSSRADAPLKVSLDGRINRRGQLRVSGTLVPAPFAADLKLDLGGVDLLPLQQFLTEKTNVLITHGALAARGRLKLASGRRGELRGGYTGRAAVTDFSSVDRLNSTDFVRWGEFGFEDVDLKLLPFAVSVGEVRLKNFYSRLILDSAGKLNLREIAAGDAEATEAAASQQAPAQSSEPPPIRIDRVVFEGGNVAFSDRFIRPNYDANLTGLGGTLEGLSSESTSLARLDLKGQVDGAAPVSIGGAFNPFREDRALDIEAEVKGFDLSAVSAYSGKYVGYGIRKGKLSAKLNYKIEDRKLSASNNIFLDQLTFGDPVESPDAIKAPVLLAVALLKNGRGEINLDLPVSGTLDDPQFSIGGLVFRAIMNLLGKAITAPFALLGSMFGGGEELAWLEFDAGRAGITETGTGKLETLAKALKSRPALKLEIAPRVDPQQDLPGLRKVFLERQLKTVKLKRLSDAGEVVPPQDEILVEPSEYAELLTEVYKAAKFERPRNFIGLLKDQPVPEMERMLLEHFEPGDEALLQLAKQRADAVRAWLIEAGGIEAERLFVVGGSAEVAGEKGGELAARVDFSLK